MARDPSPVADWKESARPIVVGVGLALLASVPVTTCVGIRTEREMADARSELEAKRDASRSRRERDLVYLQQALASDTAAAGRARLLERLTDAEDSQIAGWAREELTRANGEANARERVCKERAGQCADGCAASAGTVGACVRHCLESAWDECARLSIADRQASISACAAPPAAAPTASAGQTLAARDPAAQPALRSEPAPSHAVSRAAAVATAAPPAGSATAAAARSGPDNVDFGL